MSGDPLHAESYHGFGAPVLAAADGEVEMVVSNMEQDRVARLQRPDESRTDYRRRLGQLNQAAFEKHGLGAATGNLVVLVRWFRVKRSEAGPHPQDVVRELVGDAAYFGTG